MQPKIRCNGFGSNTTLWDHPELLLNSNNPHLCFVGFVFFFLNQVTLFGVFAIDF